MHICSCRLFGFWWLRFLYRCFRLHIHRLFWFCRLRFFYRCFRLHICSCRLFWFCLLCFFYRCFRLHISRLFGFCRLRFLYRCFRLHIHRLFWFCRLRFFYRCFRLHICRLFGICWLCFNRCCRLLVGHYQTDLIFIRSSICNRCSLFFFAIKLSIYRLLQFYLIQTSFCLVCKHSDVGLFDHSDADRPLVCDFLPCYFAS
ncbi:hypothetical protein ACHAWO_001235 [Cyclotella atomus]|uniref:Uncharacterized protein n=1 Tax=Cyclotella atomus TaxID=382360 RepID=A0ABD3NN58_9STRA